ncbi:TPA_asm: RNA-directed RNA polymerase [ssRNA phage SRR6960799_1]|uniref:RNA-directed RNA polymerase n=1 Tax=ssRNA phage SRR6960799_1 TaxID=2786565 RepID=A0A8S5KZM3_9VIRU|nr:RNA-directed RNA polymerase [ssRNA phage SRR6960799_1]DAD50651.1 TPA_asm: RNA-directed RNA polymerase [ssRNA phage SRR6960799_1]
MRPYETLQVIRQAFQKFYGTSCLRRDSNPLSKRDEATTLEVYTQYLLLLVDLGYLRPEGLKRTAHRLAQDFVRADVLVLNNLFAECAQAIRLKHVRGFKALCSQISPHLFCLIKQDVERLEKDDVEAAKRLLQAFCYTSRLSLRDIDLSQQMVDEFISVEEKIPHTFNPHLTNALNKIIRRWLGSFLPGEIVPHHGPGAVANLGRCSVLEKYQDLSTDRRLEYAFGSPWWIGNCQVLSRQSQMRFVPKSYKTFRSIGMEPATLQYFQQGVQRLLYDFVSRNRYLNNHIGFSDATRNQKLACLGSAARNYATLDLSHASDSVGYELVKKLFRGTWVYRYLICTRSTETRLSDGTVIELRKFSTMGSALCFPVETFLFAAVCELVTRAYRVSGDYTVYGDDIIVPTQCAATTTSILEDLGFEVNTSKSFSSKDVWFRESCGGEFINGFDVTPLRISRKYSSEDDSIRMQDLISLANNAYTYGFRCLRAFFLDRLFALGRVPYFSPDHCLSDNYTNYRAEKRWNHNYQRQEVKVHVLCTKQTRGSSYGAEEIRLRHWLQECYQRKIVGEPFRANIGHSSVDLKTAWLNDISYEPDLLVSDSSIT